MKILSNWIARDQKFMSKCMYRHSRSIYRLPDSSAMCVLHNDKMAWLDTKRIYLNNRSTTTGGLLVGSMWPEDNWKSSSNMFVEHIGYVDLDSCSREFVVLHTLTGNYTSCQVDVSSTLTAKFSWSEDELPNLVLHLQTRQLTKHYK